MKLTLLLFSLLLLSCVQEQKNLNSKNLLSAIYGGTQVENTDWGTTVALRKYGDFFCSGVLIDEETVATAAHCLTESADGMTVYFGNNIITEKGRELEVREIKRHPNYTESGDGGNKKWNDFGYIKLAEKVNNLKIVPILQSKSEFDELVTVNHPLTIVGFGKTEGGSIGVKYQANIRIKNVYEGEFYAGGDNGADTCNGDSGGPVFAQLKSGELRVIGLTSHSLDIPGFPACGYATMYAQTAALNSWMTQNQLTINLELNNLAEAAINYQKLIDLNPGEVSTYLLLANLYQKLGEADKLKQTFLNIEKILPAQKTILAYAIEKNDIALASQVIAILGADTIINRPISTGETPLTLAIALQLKNKTQDLSIISLLMRSGAIIDATKPYVYDLLNLAIQNEELELVNLLCSLQININNRNASGWTPLIFAIQKKKFQSAALLIKLGADVKVITNDKSSTLYYASIAGDPNLVQLLIGMGLDVNAKNKSEQFPLFMATDNGHVEIVKLLLASGADKTMKNKFGQTARDRAVMRGNAELVEILSK